MGTFGGDTGGYANGAPAQLLMASLSPVERLWLWKRRTGLTQRRAAKLLGVEERTWRAWMARGRGQGIPEVVLSGRLGWGERCALARFRTGLGPGEIPGLTREEVLKLEERLGRRSPLISYWMNRGWENRIGY